MNKINYQLVMEKLIKENCIDAGKVPRLLLHSCCGPCSSWCISVLSKYFEVTVFYYNPNIYPPEEYHMRASEQERFINEFPTLHPVHFVEGCYDTDRFYETVKGMEDIKEGGERCFRCYRLRLEEAAVYAKEHDFDFFTTTLSISPLKNAQKLNEIGQELETIYGVPYLFSDFKKKDGYKKSTQIAAEHHMYRQYYCGCVFSKKQRDDEIAAKAAEEEAAKIAVGEAGIEEAKAAKKAREKAKAADHTAEPSVNKAEIEEQDKNVFPQKIQQQAYDTN